AAANRLDGQPPFAPLGRAADATDRLAGRRLAAAIVVAVVGTAVEIGRAGTRRLAGRALDLGRRRGTGGGDAGQARRARPRAVARTGRPGRERRIADRPLRTRTAAVIAARAAIAAGARAPVVARRAAALVVSRRALVESRAFKSAPGG